MFNDSQMVGTTSLSGQNSEFQKQQGNKNKVLQNFIDFSKVLLPWPSSSSLPGNVLRSLPDHGT